MFLFANRTLSSLSTLSLPLPPPRRHPFSWVFEAIQATAAAPAAAAAVHPPPPPPAIALTGSDLLEEKAKLDGPEGEAARVALACEEKEAADAEAAAVAVARKAQEEDISQAAAATAASLPAIKNEVVSKMKADGASSERKVEDGAAAAAAIAAAQEEVVFWKAGRTSGPLEGINSAGGTVATAGQTAVQGSDVDGVEETAIGDDEDGETVLFSNQDSTYSINSVEETPSGGAVQGDGGDRDGEGNVTDGNQAQEEDDDGNRVNV